MTSKGITILDAISVVGNIHKSSGEHTAEEGGMSYTEEGAKTTVAHDDTVDHTSAK